jgi:exonuclease-1
MGITDLLKNIQLKETNIGEKTGFKSIAIDLSCYIHKTKYANECDLAINDYSQSYIYLLEKYFAFFIKNYEKIYFCFDGKTPDIKKDEFMSRREGFDSKINLAKILLKSKINENVKKAKQMLVQTIETRSLVAGICNYFKNHSNIILVSSLYEADYLLADLSKNGIVDCIMTEDSDLIAHGCDNIIYKYNYWENNCMFYTRECLLNDQIEVNRFKLFKEYCVMCGCDYFKGFEGVGPKKAFKICKDQSMYNLFMQQQTHTDKYYRALAKFGV